MPRNWQLPLILCLRILIWPGRWALAGANAWRTNSALTFSPKPSAKSSANYANLKRHAKLCALLRIWRTSSKSAGARGRARAHGPRSYSFDRELGFGKALEHVTERAA